MNTAERVLSWIGIVLVCGGSYLVARAIWPYAACAKCEGAGKFKTSSGKAWRKCRRCGGSGERLRFGRWLINQWRKS